MSLTQAQNDVLYRRLYEITNSQQPAESIRLWLGPEIRDRIGIKHSVAEYLQALLRLLNEDGLAMPEPPILRLLRFHELSIYPELQNIRSELEARKAELVGVDPYSRNRLTVGPFLDRARFRAVLRRFVDQETGPRVLVVNGPEQSGKSYSSWYVSYLNDFFPSFETFAYSAEKGLAETYTLGDVARDLANLARGPLDTMPPQRAQEKRWAQELSIWVLSHLNRSHVPFWLVLDGFRDAPPGTQALIQRLALQISQGLNQIKGRLLLFDYDAKQLPQCPLECEDLRAVERTDIFEYFQQQLLGQPPTIIERAVQEVLQRVKVSPSDPGWQAQIAQAVQEVHSVLP